MRHALHSPGVVAVAGVICAVGLSGCGSGDNPSRAANDSGNAAAVKTDAALIGSAAAAQHVADPPPVATLMRRPWTAPLGSPARNAGIFEDSLFGSMYDRLVALDPNNEVVPYLAESWTAAPDEITFKIRDGVECSDGTPVTPTVIKTSLKFTLNPENKSRLLGYVGAGPFDVEADDTAKTVTVHTGTPNNELLTAFTEPTAGIACPGSFAASEEDLKTKSFGSGPFVVSSVTPGREVTLTRHDGWTGPMGTSSQYLPQTLTFKLLDQAAAANLLAAGDIGVTSVGATDQKRFAGNESLVAVRSPTTSADQAIFNMAREPFKSNDKLREGILTGLKREDILLALNANDSNAILAESIFGAGTDCAADLTADIPSYDIAKAKALLQEAGYEYEGEKLVDAQGKQLSLLFVGQAGDQFSAPELVSGQLRELGIDAQLRSVPVAEFTTDFLKGSFDMVLYPPTAVSPAPTASVVRTITGPLLEDGGTNFLRVTDPKLDQMASDARTKPLEERCAAWEEFQKYYLSRHYSLPLGSPVGYWFSTGWDFVANGPGYWQTWTLGKRK